MLNAAVLDYSFDLGNTYLVADTFGPSAQCLLGLMLEAGVKPVVCHARTSRQMYMGEANYALLKDFGKTLPIPLCVSGDIFTPEKAIGVMYSLSKARARSET